MLPADPLSSEQGYRAWAMQMEGALEYATLWQVVSGNQPRPSGDQDAIELWTRRDSAARTMILRALSPSIVTTVDGLGTSHEFWTTLRTQYSRTSLNSAVSWIQSLVTPLGSVHELEAHIQAFQQAIGHIRSSGLNIPEQFVAGIFLSTLRDRDGEPTQWQAYTAKVTLSDTTTLNETIADVRNERRRIFGNKLSATTSTIENAMAIETAYATIESEHRNRGVKWCRFCNRDGHWGSECRSKGQQPRKRVKKKRGKDKANVAQDDDDSGSADENSHFVRSEHALYTAFSPYDQRVLSLSHSTPDVHTTDSAFVTQSRLSKSGTIVIDSGTSSHVHSVKSDFVAIMPTSSRIRGFGDGKTIVAGRGEAQVLARLPDYGCSRLRLRDTCYAPNTSPSLISVSRLDDANCYTLFGNGRCVTFEKKDGGALLRATMAHEKVVLTGTKGLDRLYHLDCPTDSDIAHTAAEVPHAHIEAIHGCLGHLNYPSIRSMIRKGRIRGIKISKAALAAEPPPCPACLKGKMTRALFPLSESGRPE